MTIFLDHLPHPLYILKTFIRQVYFKHNKKMYICSKCGLIEVPSNGECYYDLIEDYGWHKLKNPKRYICHHCAEHQDDYKDEPMSWTPDEWEVFVKTSNDKIRSNLNWRVFKWEDNFVNVQSTNIYIKKKGKVIEK